MQNERKIKSFEFNISINKNKTDIFGYINIDKYLKLYKKPIRFTILIEILLIMLMFSILNYNF